MCFPISDLGGDTFNYHWLDDNNLVFYLVDVSGHGLDSALLSVTIMNVLRSRSLPDTDFRMPGQVLRALNEAFQMESYGDKFFTIWYGVFDRKTYQLKYASGGHPPVLLYLPVPTCREGEAETAANYKQILLSSKNSMIGVFPGMDFDADQIQVLPQSRLYLYSDGVYEIHRPEGGDWRFDEFTAFMSEPGDPAVSHLDRLLEHVRKLKASTVLDDDFSMIEITF